MHFDFFLLVYGTRSASSTAADIIASVTMLFQIKHITLNIPTPFAAAPMAHSASCVPTSCFSASCFSASAACPLPPPAATFALSGQLLNASSSSNLARSRRSLFPAASFELICEACAVV